MTKGILALLMMLALSGCETTRGAYRGVGAGVDAYESSPCYRPIAAGAPGADHPCKPVAQQWGTSA